MKNEFDQTPSGVFLNKSVWPVLFDICSCLALDILGTTKVNYLWGGTTKVLSHWRILFKCYSNFCSYFLSDFNFIHHLTNQDIYSLQMISFPIFQLLRSSTELCVPLHEF